MQNSGITKSIFLLDRVTWHYSFIIIQSDNMISVSGFLGCVANCRSSEQPSASLRCLLTTSELGRTTGWEVLQLNSKDTQSYLYYMWTESWRGGENREWAGWAWLEVSTGSWRVYFQGDKSATRAETRWLEDMWLQTTGNEGGLMFTIMRIITWQRHTQHLIAKCEAGVGRREHGEAPPRGGPRERRQPKNSTWS